MGTQTSKKADHSKRYEADGYTEVKNRVLIGKQAFQFSGLLPDIMVQKMTVYCLSEQSIIFTL